MNMDRNETDLDMYDFVDYVSDKERKYHDRIQEQGLPPHDLSTVDLVRFTVSTIATGTFLALVIWALADLRHRRRVVHTISNNFFLVLAVVLLVIAIAELAEFFIIYDFLFFRSINWALHNQWLSYLVEYCRILQYSVILAFGIHQVLSLMSCCQSGMIGAAIYAAVFVANTLSLPTLALVLGIQHRHVKLDMFLHPVLFPFTASVFVSLVLYFVSKRRLFKFSGHDILATKVVLAFLLLVAVQAAEACVIDLVLIAFVKMRIVGVAINTLEDINRILLPLAYLAFFKNEARTARIFSCLNGENGVQRIPSGSIDGIEVGQELQDTTNNVPLAFPASVFSITDEESEQLMISNRNGSNSNMAT